VRNTFVRLSIAVAITVVTAVLATAQTVLPLPNETGTSMLTATVSEQASFTVPSIVSFNVTNILVPTASSPVSVNATNIVLATASKTLHIMVKGSGPVFTPSVAATPTWAVAAVSWGAATFTNGGTGVIGTMAETYVGVATCAADVASCGTTNMIFTLAANPAVTRSGNHTLLVIWKFESIG
jgi:hypothetical protein